MDSLRQAITSRLRKRGRGHAFTRSDLRDLAGTGTLGRVLARMVGDGAIRRLAPGLFDYPRVNERLGGQLSPDIDQVARALARKFRWTIAPQGALAANRLGLSQQVPAHYAYLSDGPTKRLKVGQRTILFQHARPKDLRVGSVASATVVQALRHLGRSQVNPRVIAQLRRTLSAGDRRQLVRDTRYGTEWIHDVAKAIARDE